MAGVPVRVLIADDQQLTAAGTRHVLGSDGGFELVGTAATAAEAAELAETAQPEVALVQVYLPGGGDIAVRRILAASPDTRVLAHASPPDRDSLIEMLRAGAAGYVVRDAPAGKLVAALRGAAEGSTILDGVVDRGVLHELMGQVHEVGRLHEARTAKRARIRRVIESGSSTSSSSPSSRWPRARSSATRRSRASTRSRTGRPTSGSPRRTRSALGPSSSWRRCCAPASARVRCPTACSWR